VGSIRPRALQINGIGLCVVLLAGACQLLGGPPPAPPRLNPDQVQRGALLFLSPELSGDAQRSCATCHPGGASNGHTYRGDEEVAPGSQGARDVPTLRGLWQSPPYLWDGSAPSLRAAIARMLEVEMRGGNIDEPDLSALEAYLLSIPPFERRRVVPDGPPVEPATMASRRGFEFFERAKCSLCHPPPRYARRGRFDIGTGIKLEPPSLRGVSSSPPYGHDGRWSTLEMAVRAILAAREVEYSELELTQLLSYLELL